MPNTVKVCVSSTTRELRSERATVKTALTEHLKFEAFLSEDEGAASGSPYEICKHNVLSSDFVVLILGIYYGKSHGTASSPFNREVSATHLEFLLAQQHRKPILVYIKNADEYVEDQSQFIDEVKDFSRGVSVGHFDDATEVASQLRINIASLLAGLIRGDHTVLTQHPPLLIDCETSDEASEVGAGALNSTAQSYSPSTTWFGRHRLLISTEFLASFWCG